MSAVYPRHKPPNAPAGNRENVKPDKKKGSNHAPEIEITTSLDVRQQARDGKKVG